MRRLCRGEVQLPLYVRTPLPIHSPPGQKQAQKHYNEYESWDDDCTPSPLLFGHSPNDIISQKEGMYGDRGCLGPSGFGLL